MPRGQVTRISASTLLVDRAVAIFPNHVWAFDFQLDQTADARVLKLLNISDEFAETTLAIEVGRSFISDDMVHVLERLVMVHGTPTCIRKDHGTEMTAHALRDWCRFARCGAVFIEPGTPWKTRTLNPPTEKSMTNYSPSKNLH